MKKIIYIFSLLLLFALTFVSSNKVKADTEYFSDNLSARMTAVSENDSYDSMILYYMEIADSSGVISFDLLKSNDLGYFGFFAGNKEKMSVLSDLTDYFLFGESIRSSKDFSYNQEAFESGYTYKIIFDKANSKLSLLNKEIGSSDDYTLLFEINDVLTNSNAIGIIALSDGTNSSTVLLDNFKVTNLKEKAVYVENNYDDGAKVKTGALKLSILNASNGEKAPISLMDIFDDFLYDVSFMNEAGEILSMQKVGIHGTASAPDVIAPDGYHVVWSRSLNNITSNCSIYPKFEKNADEPEEPGKDIDDDDDNKDEEEKPEGKKGCKDLIGSLILLPIGFISIISIAKRRNENE